MQDTIISHLSDIFRIEGTRIIYLNGMISHQTAAMFNTLLFSLESEDREKDIYLYINSPGGDTSAGLSMIDIMNFVSPNIATLSIGTSASMAALLLMSGTKGKRKVLPHSQILLHQPFSIISESTVQTSDLEIATKNLINTRNTVYNLIANQTGQPINKIAKDCERDFLLNAEEAIAYGIADSIASPFESLGRYED